MNKETPPIRSIILPIVIGVTGLTSMSLIAYLLNNGTICLLNISQYKIVNLTFTMQMLVLPISFIALGLMYLYNKEGFKIFFHLSLLSKKNSWRSLGLTIAAAFTLGTASLMYLSGSSENGTINKTFYSLMPLVVLFSVTNAWSEEIFSRFVIVAGLNGKLKPEIICWISAIIFGLPHFFGTPSGLFGVITSGLLGWFLAKSVIETKSLGWALLIHFLQDLIIFGAGAMIIAGQD